MPCFAQQGGYIGSGSGSSGLSTKVVYASKISGATSGVVVVPGSSATGTTDSASVINAAISGGNVDLEVDSGFALSTNLVVYSNTTIHCTAPQFGFIMQAAANVPVVMNAHQNAPTTSSGTGGYLVSNIGDTNIRINGCQLNLNSTQSVTGTNGASVPHSVNPSTGFGVPGVLFSAVQGLFIDSNEIYDTGSVGTLVSNAQNVRTTNNYIHQPTPTVAFKNTDGIHFIGPDDQLYTQNNTINSGDDSIAYNADDNNVETPSCCQAFFKNGPITNVHDDNNFLLNTYFGLRVYSGTSLIDNMEVTNLHGTACGNTGTFQANSGVGSGNVGTVLINGWNLPTSGTCNNYSQPYNFIITENIQSLRIAGVQLTNPGVNWPAITQSAGTVGILSLRDWDLNTQTSGFSNVIVTSGGTIGQFALSGINWYDNPGNTTAFLAGSVVPPTVTCSNFAGPNRLLASGYVPLIENGDCFTNTYTLVYLATLFNEAGSGTNLAGTTPATCAHGCTGPWSLASGTDLTYQTGGGVATSTTNTIFDLITSGATNGVFRFNVSACSGSANICQFVVRGTNVNNKIIISITVGTNTVIYDDVSGTTTPLGAGGGSGPLGNYAVTFNGSSVSVLDPNSVTIGPFTTANTTGTQVGLDAAAATSMKVLSMSVKSN